MTDLSQQNPPAAAAPVAAPEPPQGPAGAQATPPEGGEPAAPATPPTAVFTQADIDRVAAKVRGEEKARQQAAIDDALQKVSMGEVERLKLEKQQEAEGRLADRKAFAGRLAESEAKAAALAAGIDPKYLAQTMRLADLSAAVGDDGEVDSAAIKTAIEQVKTDFPMVLASAPASPPASGADFSGDPGKRQWTQAQIRALANDPTEYAKHEAEIDAAVREGRVLRD
jgi:hypothetical protein